MSEVGVRSAGGLDPLSGLGAEVTARIALAKVCEPEYQPVVSLAAEVGVIEAWDRVRHNAGGRFSRLAGRVGTLDVAREVYVADRTGLRILVPGDEQWPAGLDDLDSPPWCLWVRGDGDLAALCARSVAVVGARAATAYGMSVARQLAGGLAAKGFTIVSGAAFGIDAAAHQGALVAGGRSVAVLAGGADRAYPVAHTGLLEELAADGLVVSESPPGAAPFKKRFLSRNRLIAAMTGGTVVVEAGLRSGSLNTAGHAVGLGRPVAAVPGPVTSSMSAGVNELIRGKVAELVTDAEEVAELIGPMGEHLLVPKRGPDRPEDGLRGAARTVFDVLPRVRPASVDRLIVTAGLAPAEVFAALGELERSGLAQRRDTGWRRT